MTKIVENIQNRELLNTKDMLENEFFKKLKEQGFNIDNKNLNLKSITESNELAVETKDYNTEELLGCLYEIRDDLIASVQNLDIDSESAQKITFSINKIGSCIKKLGGEVETFDLLNHISGLQTPSMVKNAEKVIETTRLYYALGKVGDAKVQDNGKTIIIEFQGKKNNIEYKVIGTIKAKAWTGNEAIDYVYKKGSGKMFVRSFIADKWVDKSNAYDIAWELIEKPTEKPTEEPIEEQIEESKENIEKTIIEEGNNNSNKEINIEKNDVDDINFPIIEEK